LILTKKDFSQRCFPSRFIGEKKGFQT